ncbi:MAG: hypothetical protein KDK41_17090 [Leptospiraceae bacterium]|nr:hypothetical protein [Leptospiraceae bacterium]
MKRKSKNFNRLAMTLLAVIGIVVLNACANEDAAVAKSACDTAIDTLAPSVKLEAGTQSGNVTIAADAKVSLKGVYKVPNGSTLTIGAGATISACQSPFSTIIVERGGTINANGTSAKPVVFTSILSAGSRIPQAWGGLVIHGRSAVNASGSLNYNTDSEINTGAYGCGDTGFACTGQNNNDNSGTLTYVRVEFAGNEISAGKEFNGIFMAGVGNGTTMNHIQVHRGSDDGIEIFGGAVDLNNIIISNNQDDGFDVDEGWRGTARNVAVTVPTDGDQGIEYDGVGSEAARATNAKLSNFTILGTQNKSKEGAISVRASGQMYLANSYIAHFWGDNGVIAVASNSQSNSSATPTTGWGSSFDLALKSTFVECLYTDSAMATVYSTNDESQLACTANDPGACASRTAFATAFPDSGTSNNVVSNLNCGTAARIARQSTYSAVSHLKPASNITVGSFDNPPAAPNGTDLNAPAYVGAFTAADTWADTWTSFPAN